MSLKRALRLPAQISRIREPIRCVLATRQWPDVIARYLFRTGGFPLEFRTRDGMLMEIADWDELTTVWHVFFANEYNLPRTSTTVVDLGANIGAFALWAASQCPAARIFSIEPFPSTFHRLQSHIERNGLSQRIVASQVAVAGYDGEGRFNATAGKRSYCRALLGKDDVADSINVRCVTLTSLLNELKLSEVDCLKMDVEGGEYDILLNSDIQTLRRCKVITLEYHDGQRVGPLWAKFDESGFRRMRFADQGWSGLASYERVD